MSANQNPRFRLRFSKSQTRTDIMWKRQPISGTYSDDKQTLWKPSPSLRFSLRNPRPRYFPFQLHTLYKNYILIYLCRDPFLHRFCPSEKAKRSLTDFERKFVKNLGLLFYLGHFSTRQWNICSFSFVHSNLLCFNPWGINGLLKGHFPIFAYFLTCSSITVRYFDKLKKWQNYFFT